MSNLTITIIQTALHWEDITANLAMLEEKIWSVPKETDIVVLPEMFNTGFTQRIEKLAEPMNGRTCKWMKQMAYQLNAAIVGSIVIKEDQNFFNRLLWVQPDGVILTYDKHHLFSFANEHIRISRGQGKRIVQWRNWKIMPLICYDLRFPVWSRNAVYDGETYLYDILMYVAAWPATRGTAWQYLLKGRAIENACICVGTNIVGTDGNGIPYVGFSNICDPMGNSLVSESSEETLLTATLLKDELITYRKKFPFLLDADAG